MVNAGVDRIDVGRVGLRATRTPPRGLTYAVSAIAAHGFVQRQSLNVGIPGFGLVGADRLPRETWFEYGGQLGYALGRGSSLGVFVTGLAGSKTVGRQAHVGLDFKVAL